MDAAVIVAIALVAVLVSITPLVRVPLGLVLGIAVLGGHLGIATASLIGAAGVTAGRLWMSDAARRGRDTRLSPSVRAERARLGGWLAHDPRFGWLTFLAGLVPMVPDWFVFPLLGRIGAPLRYAALGSLLGRWPLLALTTWLSVAVSRALTGSDDAAMGLLGAIGIVWALIGFLRRIDLEHLRATGRIRMNERAQKADERLTEVMLQATRRSRDDPDGDAGSGDVIDAEVVEPDEDHESSSSRDS